MKCLMTALTMLWCTIAFGQKWYIKAGVGYAMPYMGQTMDPETNLPYSGIYEYGNNALLKFKTEKVSFNTGIASQAGIGYMLNEHIAVEANYSVGIGTKLHTATITNSYTNSNNQHITENIEITNEAKPRHFIVPALVLQSGGKMVKPYMRVGVMLPLSTKVETKYTVLTYGYANPVTQATLFERRGKFSPGLSASVGLKGNFTKKFGWWAEGALNAYTMTIRELEFLPLNGRRFPFGLDPTITYTSQGEFGGYNAYEMPFSNLTFTGGLWMSF